MIYLKEFAYIPVKLVHDFGVEKVTDALTCNVKNFDPGEKEDVTIRQYDFRDIRGERYITVPIAFFLRNKDKFPDKVKDIRSDGIAISVNKVPDPYHDKVLHKREQAEFMSSLVDGLKQSSRLLGVAPTGLGKTVCGLFAAASLGRKTLVVVHLHKLAQQWAKEIELHLGVSQEDIGWVYGTKCNYKNKKFVILILKSMALKDPKFFPEGFFSEFGFTIFDEVHRVPTDKYNRAVSLVTSRYVLGLSATMNRKDGASKVIYNSIGTKVVSAATEAMPITVCVVNNPIKSRLWGNKHGALMSCLEKIYDRNMLLCHIIKRLYDDKRNVFVISTSISHLEKLMRMCAIESGIPHDVMGLYTRTRKVDGIVKKNKDSAIDFIKDNARVIFTNYVMASEGLDIPRLDAGVDATPRASATQVIGRVRRYLPGKRKALWVTIHDRASGSQGKKLDGYFYSRMKDYQSTGADVLFVDRERIYKQEYK